jgi:hypothetical protein
VLVLDDYHFMTAEPVHDALASLLEHQPPQMHTVLLTRTDPPLPLARLRVRNQLVDIRYVRYNDNCAKENYGESSADRGPAVSTWKLIGEQHVLALGVVLGCRLLA